MQALFDGGRERTVTEYDELVTAAGLRMTQTLPTQVPGLTIIEADTG